MSALKIKAALEIALASITPALITVFENADYVPVTGTPYQRVNIMSIEPENPTFGDNFRRERGIFQVSLMYPLNAGAGTAITQAELIRQKFYRGATFVNAGVTVTIERTPEVSAGYVDVDRWRVPVKVRFYANI